MILLILDHRQEQRPHIRHPHLPPMRMTAHNYINSKALQMFHHIPLLLGDQGGRFALVYKYLTWYRFCIINTTRACPRIITPQ